MDSRVATITSQTLTPLVQSALDNSSVQLGAWNHESVHGGMGGAIGGTALYRFTGQTTEHNHWSLMLKVLYERPDESESSPYYWKREYEIYRSGMLEQLPTIGMTSPKVYGLDDFGDSCWIWMEDIQDTKQHWAIEDYSHVARQLGRFNGAYVMGHPMPDYNWLTHDWHSAITPALADTFENLDILLDHPLAQRTLPLDKKENIKSIWENIELYRDALTHLPKTLCHIDAFRRNLLHREGDIVLIDWALAGHATIGQELVPLVAVSLYMDAFSIDYANALDNEVFKGYIVGLRDAGWQGDAQLARIGYTCAMTLRGLAGVKQDLGLILNADNHANLKEIHHTDNISKIADFFADVRCFRLIQMAEEARNLLA